MKINEQELAEHMLDTRREGPSVKRSLKKGLYTYAYHALLAIGFIILAKSSSPGDGNQVFFAIAGGIFIGTILRDIGWYKKIKTAWPFNEKITDWQTVEEIAKGK